MEAFARRCGRVVEDAFGLFLIPWCVLLLPWSLGFRLLKALSHWRFLYRHAVDAQWQGAAAFVPATDVRAWKNRARLTRLVEHADAWLMVWRGDGWWRRHVRIDGTLPANGRAMVFLTYHWGTGNWIWSIFKAHGIRACFLARQPDGRSLGLTRLSSWYGRLRTVALRRAGARVLFTGNSASVIRGALGEGTSVVGMLDFHVGDGRRTLALPLYGREAHFPYGLARIAVDIAAPVVLFSLGLDLETGRRDLRIEMLTAGDDAQSIMQAYARHLDRRLHEHPEAWLLWRDAGAIFAGTQLATSGSDVAAVGK